MQTFALCSLTTAMSTARRVFIRALGHGGYIVACLVVLCLCMASAPAKAGSTAVLVSQRVPSTMLAGQVYSVSVTMKNTGTTTWTRELQYALGSQNPENGLTWGLNRVRLPASIGPGALASFSFQVTAPAAAGTYNFQWRMVRDGTGGEWFGPYTPNIAVTVKAPGNDAELSTVSVPATMLQGRTYSVSVTMKNTGATTWTNEQHYALGSQNPENGLTWGPNRVSLPSPIAPGALARFTFPVTAPMAPGAHNFQWRMVRDGAGGEWFGPYTRNLVVTVQAPVNGAELSAISVPGTMVQGRTYSVSVTMKNTGTTTWTAGAGYKLGSENPQNNLIWGMKRVELTRAVSPGQRYIFAFRVTAPASGDYAMRWRMVQEGEEWFGAMSNSPVTVSAAAGSPTISVTRTPAPMTAGQAYTLTWSSTNATSVSRVCTASAGGYTVNDAPALSGSASGTASAAWVGHPSSCTWTARGASGTATAHETMTTNAGATTTAGAVTYIHTDGLGSPVTRTDANGKVISRTRYEPYGLTAAGDTPTIGFTGHVNDADTGLVYMQQRYYDPLVARFLSIDPIVTEANTGSGFNRYAYADNNPFSYIDPDGRNSEITWNSAGTVVSIRIPFAISDPSGVARFTPAEVAQQIRNRLSGNVVIDGHNVKVNAVGVPVALDSAEVRSGQANVITVRPALAESQTNKIGGN